MNHFNRYKKVLFVFSLVLISSGVQAGNWSAPAKIVQTGSWGPWFGVVVTDTGAASGCSGTGTKAIDISTFTPTSKAQVALLLAAQAMNKSVLLYYDYCIADTTVITNVQVVQ